MPAATKKRGQSDRRRTLNDFKTFKNRFPNMVSVLNEIIASENLGKHRKDLDLDLEAIFKMVVSRDKKIRHELVAADYFVDVFKKMGLTEKMIMKLEKYVPKIIDKAKTSSMKSVSAIQIGGQPQTHRILSIWIIILLLIVQYLLFQIIISSDDLSRIQDSIRTEQNRLQEINRNCTLQTLNEFGHSCRSNFADITSYNATLTYIANGGFFNRGFSAHDIQLNLIPPGLSVMFQNMPMLTTIVGIICLMNFGTIYLIRIRNTNFYDQREVAGLLEERPLPPPRQAIGRQIDPLDVDPDADDDAPDDFKDLTLTSSIMRDPVVAHDGITYDRDAIERWFHGHNTSPATGALMSNKTIIPNVGLRKQIVYWKQHKAAAAAAAAADAAAADAAAAAAADAAAADAAAAAAAAATPAEAMRRRRAPQFQMQMPDVVSRSHQLYTQPDLGSAMHPRTAPSTTSSAAAAAAQQFSDYDTTQQLLGSMALQSNVNADLGFDPLRSSGAVQHPHPLINLDQARRQLNLDIAESAKRLRDTEGGSRCRRYMRRNRRKTKRRNIK